MNNLTISNNLMEILITFITITGTYFITKYQIINPSKISIQQQRLENVYLPLYRLVSNTDAKSIDTKTLAGIMAQTASIIDKNFLLICPDLSKAYSDLQNSIETNLNVSQAYKRYCNIISFDYEKLKRNLGYPSESYKDFFLRADTPTKLREILGYINLIAIFVPVITISISNELNAFIFIRMLILYFFIFFTSTRINSYLIKIQQRK